MDGVQGGQVTVALPTAADMMALPNARGLDLLFDAVDSALWAGGDREEWPAVESWLDGLDPADLSSTLIVGVLSITLPVKTLPSRVRWVPRARAALEAIPGVGVDGCLKGLE